MQTYRNKSYVGESRCCRASGCLQSTSELYDKVAFCSKHAPRHEDEEATKPCTFLGAIGDLALIVVFALLLSIPGWIAYDVYKDHATAGSAAHIKKYHAGQKAALDAAKLEQEVADKQEELNKLRKELSE